jgi:hypothetical protein
LEPPANGGRFIIIDPLASDAVLKTMLQNNTTLLVRRKGTGKSTVFAKSQFVLRKRADVISVYIYVNSLHEILIIPTIKLDDGVRIDDCLTSAPMGPNSII